MQWPEVRRAILFVLGLAVVIDALVSSGSPVGELVVGLVLIGIIPVDELVQALAERLRGK